MKNHAVSIALAALLALACAPVRADIAPYPDDATRWRPPWRHGTPERPAAPEIPPPPADPAPDAPPENESRSAPRTGLVAAISMSLLGTALLVGSRPSSSSHTPRPS